MEEKKLDYTIEEIEKFDENDWTKFRNDKWTQKKQIYNEENVIPDWFLTWQKDEKIKKKAWSKKCKAYSSEVIPDWFMSSKQDYVNFLKKLEEKEKKSADKDKK